MKKLLLVANVAKEHVLKFHVPTIKALVEDGWQVDVACGGKEEIPHCRRQIELPIDRSPFKTHFFKAVKQLKKVIADERYDIVYCHTEVGGIVARLAARKFRKQGIKVIKLDHGFYFFKGASWLTWLIHYPIDKLLSYYTDTFILINKEDYNFATKHFHYCTTRLIDGIGIDRNKFADNVPSDVRKTYREQWGVPNDACVLIYLAEISDNKNQYYLLRGLKRLLERDENIYLVLAGRDLSEGAFQQMAEKMNVMDHLRMLGWRNDVKALYCASDICTASSIREGFGINIVEAMACGIPVVATKNRGHSTIIRNGENGLLTDLNDIDSFVDAVDKLRTDDDLKEKLVTTAYAELEKFFSDKIVEKIENILSEK